MIQYVKKSLNLERISRVLPVTFTILLSVFFSKPALADAFYFPWEYNSLYSEKVALELELRSIQKRYENDRKSLMEELAMKDDHIKRVEELFLLEKKNRATDKKDYEDQIESLKKSISLLGRKMGSREQELLKQNRELEQTYYNRLEHIKNQLESEREKCIKELADLRDAMGEMIRDKDRRIQELGEELSYLRELSESQQAELNRLQEQEQKLSRMLEKEIAKGDIRIKKMHDRIIINIDDRISFDSGSDTLKPQVSDALGKISDILNDYPENRVVVEGHTDNIPIRTARFKDNWELSTARALSVLHFLLERSKISPERFSVGGYGEYRPTVPNNTPENRSLNRRVDIVLIPRSLDPSNL
jgi:chemotaxis protein MotB